MKRWPALLWLLLVAAAGVHLTFRAIEGLPIRTDLLALLPRESQDPTFQEASDQVTQSLARRLVLLIGHEQVDDARQAAAAIEGTLIQERLLKADTLGGGDTAALGAFYFAHRAGLLADGDRALLQAGKGEDIAQRALTLIYSVGSFADSRLLAADPFLLLPSFLAALPRPATKLGLDGGRLGITQNGMSWVLVSGRIVGDAYELDFQERLIAILEGAYREQAAAHPGLQMKRAGAVFFARAGANTGMREASTLGTISLFGTLLLIVAVFRRAAPFLLNFGTLLIGTGVALSGTLLIFGDVHIMTLLFGVGLIGVAVDYGLHYSTSLFDPAPASPQERMRHVLPGITLGLLTTLIGYVILVLAPFPGLRQIAVFSALGLLSAFATVVLWFPLLETSRPARHGRAMIRIAETHWDFWRLERHRIARWILAGIAVVIGALGLLKLESDDDVRHMQSLEPALVAQQSDIQHLTGISSTWQSLLILAADDEAALQTEETLAPVLDRLVSDNVISGFRMPADYVPSIRRQRENAALVRDRLDGTVLMDFRAQLGLPSSSPTTPADSDLTVKQVIAADVLPFLSDLVPAYGRHLVALDGLSDETALRAAIARFEGVRFINPAGDFTSLLGKYRQRAVWLIGLSAILMLVPLTWRYGVRGAVLVMVPPVAALILAPALIALIGQAISFFHVMALILVLSIGVDYGIFCAEVRHGRQGSTLLGVVLATLTTLLSFGVLSFSSAFAVHAFGLTLLLGVLIAFLLSPIAAHTTSET